MIKKLAGQTAIYGIPSIVGRLINFLLIFLFTAYFKPEIFAAHVEFYAYAAFLLVLLPHGMETAFFNFLRRKEDLNKVFTASIVSVLVLSSVFLITAILFRESIAHFMGYSNNPEYVVWFGLILFFDVMSMIPFALLRHLEEAKRFAFIRSFGIFLNVVLNVLFIVYFPRWFTEQNLVYNPEIGIGYVFLANLIGSAGMLLLLLPKLLRSLSVFDLSLWKKMIKYSWPLILVGLAGIVNETFDRVAMDKLLVSDNPKFELGVYGAFYKLSIIITIFIQAFRYAAEPFFFEQSKGQDAKETYARVMNYFVMVCLSIGLITLFFLDWIAPLAIRQSAFFDHPDGIKIVAPLILANIFLGIVYNLSIWYKVEEKNNLGAAISVVGAVLTIICLFIFIPKFGFIAAAYTTLLVYITMAAISYFMGQKHYPVPYDIKKISILFGAAILFYILDVSMLKELNSYTIFFKLLIWISFTLLSFLVVIRVKKT